MCYLKPFDLENPSSNSKWPVYLGLVKIQCVTFLPVTWLSIIMKSSFHSGRIFREMRILSLLGFIALLHGFKYDQKSDPWRFEIEFENEATALKFENIDGWFLEDGIKYSLSDGNLQIDRKKLYGFSVTQSETEFSYIFGIFKILFIDKN